MSQTFFSPALFSFLEALKTNNNKDWFTAHRTEFETLCREPFLNFIAALAPGVNALEAGVVIDPRPVGGSMMRINRDIRFSKDKSPYKTALSAQFKNAKGRGPGLFIRLSPEGSLLGAGIWQPEPDVLFAIRQRINLKPEAWREAVSESQLGKGCGLGGESLSRPPAGFDANHPLIADIKRKDFITSQPLTREMITSPDLLDTVLEYYRRNLPFIEFLAKAL